MNLAKFDELDSLIRGMLYIETTNPHECYYWSNPTDNTRCQKVPYDFSEPYPFLVRIYHPAIYYYAFELCSFLCLIKLYFAAC